MHSSPGVNGRRLWLRLFVAQGVGSTTVARLRDEFQTVEEVFAAGVERFHSLPGGLGVYEAIHHPDLEPHIDRLEEQVAAIPGARLVTPTCAEYPSRLRKRSILPAALFVRGSLQEQSPALAVVGSRRTGAHSAALTRDWCQELAAGGVSIVSGLAEGIDAAAHEGALLAPGHTVAVLGTGLAKTYPRNHAALQDRILATGGAVISQFAPFSPMHPGLFPARNATMAALSDAVLVMQAGTRSGALITAEYARRFQVPVLAVPSHPGDPTGAGCLQLLKKGALLVTSTEDVAEVLGGKSPAAARPKKEEPVLPDELRKVYDELDFQGSGLDELTRRLDWPAGAVLDVLLRLELAGVAARQPGPRYVRTK